MPWRVVRPLLNVRPPLTSEHKMSPCVGLLVAVVLSDVTLSLDCTSRGLFELDQRPSQPKVSRHDQQLKMGSLP